MLRNVSLKGRRGFTLIELLVVIAIIAILIGLLLPAVQKVREAANRADSMNNMKQIGLAANMYNNDNERLPHNGVTGANPTSTTATKGSWAYQMLPYMEQKNFYDTPSATITLATFTCKQRGRAKGVPFTDYAWNCFLARTDLTATATAAAALTPSTEFGGRTVQSIEDGSSNTILAGHKGIVTPYPAPVAEINVAGGTASTGRLNNKYGRDATNAPTDGWGGPFTSGGLFVFADGSAKGIPFSSGVLAGGTTPTGTTTGYFAAALHPADGKTLSGP